MEEIFYTDLLALVEQDGFKAVRKSTSRGGQYNGPCPFCNQGHDRFRVQPHQGTYGWYTCAQCGEKGNAVDYLMNKRGLSKGQALLTVGWKPKDGSDPHITLPAYALDERPQWDEPSERWQDAARDFYRTCRDLLWSEAGRAALDYLRERGLTDTTITSAMLGYHPKEAYGAAHVWGKQVRLWQGIVIPWISGGSVWRLTIRDERVTSGNGRYKQVSGGSNGLYLADSLLLKRPAVVVTEGEFDALSVAQSCGSSVAVVATGTTQGGHTPRWLTLLSRQKKVLIAFDGEEKGDKAAAWWLERLNHAQRLRPLWKDANQMLQDGVDLTEWVQSSGVFIGYLREPFDSKIPLQCPEQSLIAPAQEEILPAPDPLSAQEVPEQEEKAALLSNHSGGKAPKPGSYNEHCTTQIYLSEKHPQHICIPFWLDPQSKRFSGWEERNTFLRGHTDVAGNWWCGHCFYQYLLINRGAQLGYPQLPEGYVIDGYPSSGYEGWLALGRFGGCVRVETAVRFHFAPAGQQWKYGAVEIAM